METLFLLLFFVSFIALIVGLVKPTVFSRFIKGEKTRKNIATIFGIATVASFVLLGVTADSSKNNQVAQQPVMENIKEQNSTQLSNTSAEQPKQKEITYEILERWTIPNGGEGKKILIPKDYINDADMTALGNKLKQDTANDRNAFIQVYTNRQAAVLRDKVLAGDATQAENDLYDQNYVGQYNKNGNNGLHQFTIFFDGVMGTNQKTISY